jgi:hypothetical protein
MNGQKVFEALSEMTEEQRKCCSFWWLVDSRLLRNDIEFILFDLLETEPGVTALSEVADKFMQSVPVDDIEAMLDICESNMSEYAVDGYWDEYQGRYYSWFEDKAKEYLKKEKEDGKSSCEA